MVGTIPLVTSAKLRQALVKKIIAIFVNTLHIFRMTLHVLEIVCSFVAFCVAPLAPLYTHTEWPGRAFDYIQSSTSSSIFTTSYAFHLLFRPGTADLRRNTKTLPL